MLRTQAKQPIRICRFNRVPPWKVKHAAFLDGEAIWPHTVEERGQPLRLSADHAPRFSSVAVWLEEWLGLKPQQQERRCYQPVERLWPEPLRARQHRQAVCSS